MFVAAAFCPQPPLLVPELAAGAAGELAGLRAACDEAVRRLLAAGAERLYVLGAGPRAAYHRRGGRGTLAGFGVAVPLRLGQPAQATGGPDGGAPGTDGHGRGVAGPAAGGLAAGSLATGDPDGGGPDGDGELPVPLGLGGWLLERAGRYPPVAGVVAGPDGSLPPDVLADLELTGPAGLLVMGDGSGRRDEGAPGYLDPRAVPYDDSAAVALASGDPAALAAVDPVLGAKLLAAGAPAWRAAGGLLAGGLLAGGRYAAELLYAGAPYGVAYLVASWRRR